jgi:hypothetical protein
VVDDKKDLFEAKVDPLRNKEETVKNNIFKESKRGD